MLLSCRFFLLLSSLAFLVASTTSGASCDGGEDDTCKTRPALSTASVADLEVQSTDPDVVAKAVAIYREHGCVVVRGLNSHFVDPITKSIERTVAQSRRLKSKGKLEKLDEGWVTPDGTLWIPAPKSLEGEANDRADRPVIEMVKSHSVNASSSGDKDDLQIMVLAVDYQTSSALFQCASAPGVLDIVEGIFGSPNIELFGNGQVVYKVPNGGHTVRCHQDAAFFEFGGSGLSPVGTLNYQVATNTNPLSNGAIHVWPGSHRRGYIQHGDTSSHLGLPAEDWPLSTGLAVNGEAGDSILFHQFLVHASPPNLSDRPRPTFINRYTRPEDPVVVPLATTAAGRRESMAKAARGEAPQRKRGYMLRGDRVFSDSHWDLGDKSKGQFH